MKIWIGLAFIMILANCGKSDFSQNQTGLSDAQTNFSPAILPNSFGDPSEPKNSLYLIEKDSEIENFSLHSSAENKFIKLPADSEVSVVQIWEMPEVGQVAEIYIDSDDLDAPSEAWVRMDDLNSISQPIDADAEITDFIMSLTAGRKTPSCYRDVKFELLRRHLVNRYPPGAAAWMGYDILRLQFGFKPVAFSQNLPDGAVCVSQGGRYKCGNVACGHIAVKIGKSRWYGAGVFPHPLLRGHFNLRCLVKKK